MADSLYTIQISKKGGRIVLASIHFAACFSLGDAMRDAWICAIDDESIPPDARLDDYDFRVVKP